MLLKNLQKVYISKAIQKKNNGEYTKTWEYKGMTHTVDEVNKMTVREFHNMLVRRLRGKDKTGIAWLNLQQDVNELDRKSTGEVNYDIYKARTDRQYAIENGDGISLTDISEKRDFKPEYRVLDHSKIGNTIVYRLEKYYGD